jgi:O-antigen/teichoic acid export membrane protein
MNSSPPTDALAARPVESSATLRFAREVGRFAWLQMFVQLIGFTTGILLVRRLEQHEYALFTIANTMQGAINVLADIGIGIGLISIGGRVWQNPHRFGELVSTGMKLRRKLGAVSVLVVTPVLYFMLVKNGASVFYAAGLIAAVLAGLYAQLSFGVLDVVPRLHSDFRQIQKIDFTGSLARLAVIGALALVFLNAGLAVLVGSGTLLLQYLMLRRYAAGMIDLHAAENPEDRKAMIGFIRSRAANAMFFCLQGQITIFLITFFGHRVGAVAEVGALGRLAMIFSVLGNLLTNIFAPAFARCQERRQLGWLYAGIAGGVAGFSLLVLGGAALLPNEFLFVLGSKYSHLQHALLLMVGGAILNMMASTVWTLNASRAWIVGSWLYIPITLGTQLLLIPFTDFSSVDGVLTFNLISIVPSLLLNLGLSYRGFRQPLPGEIALASR